MLIISILDAIKPSCERIDIMQMIIGLTFVMKYTGSRSCDLSKENGVMTLSGWDVDLFEFSDCSVLATFLV